MTKKVIFPNAKTPPVISCVFDVETYEGLASVLEYHMDAILTATELLEQEGRDLRPWVLEQMGCARWEYNDPIIDAYGTAQFTLND